MNQQPSIQRLETLGYDTLPRFHPDSPGYSGLSVVLRQSPQGHEPEMIKLRLHEWDDMTTTAHLHADINQQFSHVVCPGQIVIRSPKEREVTFYTFGGSIESKALPGETVYSFRSVVPVLELLPEQETIADLLADKSEVLLARIKAQQQLSSQELWDRLVKAGPEAVYLAVLQSLLLEDEATAVPDHLHNDFNHMLTREQNWYQKTGRWPLMPRDLATLINTMGE